MKFKLAILSLFIALLVSCSEDKPAPAPEVKEKAQVQEEEKEEPKVEPEEEFVPYKEKVCIEINGKEKCRTITKHKKHEGTKIKK